MQGSYGLALNVWLWTDWSEICSLQMTEDPTNRQHRHLPLFYGPASATTAGVTLYFRHLPACCVYSQDRPAGRQGRSQDRARRRRQAGRTGGAGRPANSRPPAWGLLPNSPSPSRLLPGLRVWRCALQASKASSVLTLCFYNSTTKERRCS